MGHSIDPVRVELAAEPTWPAEESIPLGPWRMRATHGYSHRANSVRTAHAGSETFDWHEMIHQAEAFYRARELPAMFHLSPATKPDDLDAVLAGRGYEKVMRSEVWFADPAQVRDATGKSKAAGELVFREEPDEPWLSCALDEKIGRFEIREQICRRLPTPRVFAAITLENKPIARALSVVHSGIAWLYCMATKPEHQRKGYAKWLLHALADWAIANSAEAFYLQVMAQNSPAKGLYSQTGFAKQYGYHYRVLANDK